MKLRVLHDEAGVIVAAVAIGADGEIVPEPVPSPGETLVDLEVPGEHYDEDFLILCTRHRVDVGQARLVPLDDSDATR